MLTSELAIVVYEGGRAYPDRLTRQTHGHYVAHAERMLDVYRSGIGQTQRELHRSIEGIFADEPDCEPRRIRAFCKLLDDASRFDTDRYGKASALRMAVFERAARHHPLVRQPDRLFESGDEAVKQSIAAELGKPWAEIEAGLYADVMDFQPLRAFEGYSTAEDLLSRYNVAQVQACLYRAERMTVTAMSDFKTVLRYIKLARLLHEIELVGPLTYRFHITGPASVLHETRRYGVNMARFLPALLSCDKWLMEAVVQTPWGRKATLALSSKAGYRSHLPAPEEFDSALEESFAKKFGEERGGWRLLREAEILHDGQVAYVPDFVFRHESGVEILFEIVGFWTPEYLAHRRETLRRFRDRRMLMAVPARSIREGAEIPPDILVYKSALKIEPVLEALERLRAGAAVQRG